ncbi:hypothetical protein GCM10010485_82160 [Streptosporangium carneum]
MKKPQQEKGLPTRGAPASVGHLLPTPQYLGAFTPPDQVMPISAGPSISRFPPHKAVPPTREARAPVRRLLPAHRFATRRGLRPSILNRSAPADLYLLGSPTAPSSDRFSPRGRDGEQYGGPSAVNG